MNTQAVRVDPEFQRLIPRLAEEERAQLEANIEAEGCRDALVLWNGILLDGHNRFEICQQIGRPFRTTELTFPDRLAASIWILENQLARRNLTDDQRAWVTTALLDALASRSRRERAVTARAAVEKRNPTKKPDLGADATPESGKRDKTRVRKQVSNQAKVSERKVRQARTIRQKAPDLGAKIASGEMSLADAVRETKRKDVVERLDNIATKEAKAIRGVYDVVVIDPPWPMEKIERDEREQQVAYDYPTMSEEKLRAFTVPCAEACHVWLWTTQRFLPFAFDLLAGWNLIYVCTFVWHKPGGFQPIGLPQYNCEFALYARRGRPSFIDTKAFPTCLSAPRGRHSEKPDLFYETIRRVTAGRRVDMFSRRTHDGFEPWGKEAV